MIARVKSKFVDKYTGKVYRRGEIIELAEERLAEIRKVLPAAVEEIAEEAAAAPDPGETKSEKPKKAKSEKKTEKSGKKSE